MINVLFNVCWIEKNIYIFFFEGELKLRPSDKTTFPPIFYHSSKKKNVFLFFQSKQTLNNVLVRIMIRTKRSLYIYVFATEEGRCQKKKKIKNSTRKIKFFLFLYSFRSNVELWKHSQTLARFVESFEKLSIENFFFDTTLKSKIKKSRLIFKLKKTFCTVLHNSVTFWKKNIFCF